MLTFEEFSQLIAAAFPDTTLSFTRATVKHEVFGTQESFYCTRFYRIKLEEEIELLMWRITYIKGFAKPFIVEINIKESEGDGRGVSRSFENAKIALFWLLEVGCTFMSPVLMQIAQEGKLFKEEQ